MEGSATILLLLGADVAYTPYAPLWFEPEEVCTTVATTELDPLDEDFGTQETTTCVTPEGWWAPEVTVGEVFPALTLGLGVERDRLRLTALFTVGPSFAAEQPVRDAVIQPDLALGGQLVLEGVVVQGPFPFALGALGALRGFGAHGVHDDSGEARLWSGAQLSGGPALSVGWAEPRLLLRAYGVYTTSDTFGGGVTLTWSPLVLAAGG